jgi:hypothetical protein
MSLISEPGPLERLLLGSPVPSDKVIFPNVFVSDNTLVEVAAPVETFKFVTARLVVVAFVIVALVANKLVIVEVIELKIDVNRFVDVEFVIEAFTENVFVCVAFVNDAFVAKIFVLVEFVIVPRDVFIDGKLKLVTDRLVIVALVIVALAPTAFVKLEVEA